MNHVWLWIGLPALEVPVASPLAKVMERGIFRMPKRRRKAAPAPSEIPTLKDYTARLIGQKWLRLAARRKHA